MQAHEDSSPPAPIRTPWNKGKLIGAKPPLWPKHVWSIRTKLHIEGRILELALFNLAIDSKLRGCDVVALKVEDIAPNGYPVARATVRQKKTRRPVRFELTDHTREAVDAYLKMAGKKPSEFLFTSPRRPEESMTTRQYALCFGLDCRHQAGPACVRHALAQAHKGNTDLSPDGQPARGTAIARPHQDRE